MAARKLIEAQFVFEEHKVVFAGSKIRTYRRHGDLNAYSWCRIDEWNNPWDSSRKEDDGVNRRMFSPKFREAEDILRAVLAHVEAKKVAEESAETIDAV